MPHIPNPFDSRVRGGVAMAPTFSTWRGSGLARWPGGPVARRPGKTLLLHDSFHGVVALLAKKCSFFSFFLGGAGVGVLWLVGSYLIEAWREDIPLDMLAAFLLSQLRIAKGYGQYEHRLVAINAPATKMAYALSPFNCQTLLTRWSKPR